MTNRDKELSVSIVFKPDTSDEEIQFDYFDESTEDIVHAIIKSCAHYCGLKFLSAADGIDDIDYIGRCTATIENLAVLDHPRLAFSVIKSIIYNPEDSAMKYILELVDGLMYNGPDYSDLFIEEFFESITDINHVFENIREA